MIRNFIFINEIECLLEAVPSSLWKAPDLRRLMYREFLWLKVSSIAIQMKNDDRYQFACWKYYDCASSDCFHIHDELAQYSGIDPHRFYHDLLPEAAEALLSIDFKKYGQPETIQQLRFLQKKGLSDPTSLSSTCTM
jgi:hypothetical protein